jgi:thiamine phosphate synthase YjbQ (UPF0047 family)
MKQAIHHLEVETSGKGLVAVTRPVLAWVAAQGIATGLLTAHLRAMLTDTQLSIPVADGRPVLGTWQGLYLFEHRRQPHRRDIVLHLLGE